MRTIPAIIALFSLGGICAQPPASEGRELPRCEVIAYPSAPEANAADGGDNRYLTRIPEWGRKGNVLSVPFTVPFAWANRQVLFRIESASSDYEVRVNGLKAGYNADENSPAEFNITKMVHEGRNTLEIELSEPSQLAPLESWKEPSGPAVGQAWIMSQPTMRVRDVTISCRQGDDADGAVAAEVGIVVKSSALNPRTSRFHYELLTPTGETAAAGHKDLTLDMRREDTLRFLAHIPSNLLWSAELPTLYTLRLKTQQEGRFVEYLELPVGFRTVSTDKGRLHVNGREVKLRGYVVDPATVTENLLARLRELGYNTLRLTPGPVPTSLLEMCDQMGVYVVAQAPIDSGRSGESRRKEGNPTNDPAWKGAYIERTEDSYHTTKRHPSVIAFSLARNSANGINLYESYLNLKRFGDPRPVIYPDGGGEWNDDPLVIE